MTYLIPRAAMLLAGAAGLVALAGCDQKPAPAPPVIPAAAAAAPAAAPVEPFQKYVADPTLAVTHTGDAAFFEHFCHNVTGGACTPDTYKLFEAKGFVEGGPASDLANAATLVRAAADGAAGEVSNEAFVTAAYRAILGREPDELGKTNNIASLAGGKPRSFVILGMLQSEEFRRFTM